MPGTDNLLIDLDILRKEEIAQRRKVRIQQVRLQSKDIANKVLRDIQIEKNRQFQLNKAKEEDVFKKWQERKISEVNLLYKENISRLGEAYRNAEKEPDPEKEIEERSLKLTAIAKDRGKKAMDRLRREQENAKIHKETSAARREKVRKVENMRSSLISSLPTSGNYGDINEEPTDLEEDSYGRSTASNNEDSIEKFVEEVTHPRLHPKIPNLSLGSAGKPSEKISVQTSCKSAQNRKHPVAFTVDLYDRSNPCTFTQRLPDTVRVERISSEAWRNAAEAAAEEEKSEIERKEKKERELKATEERGKKALAKELIRRDFDQLMLRLDGLARKERLVRGLVEPYLPVDMYMSESRCAAKAEKRQRNLDSVFEGMLYSNGVEETQKVMETQSPPLIEKARVPEGWLPMLSETPPEILNVGLQIDDTTNLSIENATEEIPSNENISFKEASTSLPPSALSKEKIPGDSRRTELHKEDFIKDSNEPVKIPSRDSTISRSEDVQDSVQEDTQVSISSGTTPPSEVVKVPDIVKIVDKDAHCSSDEKQEFIPRREACIQTEDLANKTESSLGMEKKTVVLRGESDSSSLDNSMKIEEVRVVLRFNDSSLPSAEESGISTSALKMGKKKVVVWQKHCKMTSDEKVKTVINLESPEASVRERDKEQEPRKSLPVGNGKKQKRRKRIKEDVFQTEKSMHFSALKSASPIGPSVEDIASERRAKALLKEVRAQRKEIERLRAGLSEPKTEAPLLGCYVRRLLSMTRESVEALSVSDVSTPSIHLDSPKRMWSRVEEETLEKFEVERVDKATSPVPCSALSVDEVVSLETSSTKLTSSSKSSSTDSFPVSSPCITSPCDSVHDSSHDAVQSAASPVVHLKPPSPNHLSPLTPPPSPEYDQLADLHFRRIHDLATQLMIVRENKKKFLSDDRSSENEKSSSSSISLVSKVNQSESSSSDHSEKRNEDLPMKVSEVESNLDVPDLSIPAKESSEDISLPEDIFLDLEKPSRLSQEVLSLRRKPSTKSGPPTTPLKGLKWPDFDFQIPHELSTITEVDSKLISALSIPESRKDKDLQTSIGGANEILSAEAVTKTVSIDHPEEVPVKPLKETSVSLRTPKQKVNLSETPLLQASSPHDKSLERISESEIRTSEPASEEKSLDSESISPEYSDIQVPQTLDEVFRILGISPTIFKRPDSPLENVIKELSTEEHLSPSLHSDSKTDSLEKNIVMSKDEQVSELGKEVCHSSESFGRSPFGASFHQLRHSTPLHSSSSGTASSASDSKQTSGFPFLGESAPSSICSNGTPQGGNWRNIDDDESATPKGG